MYPFSNLTSDYSAATFVFTGTAVALVVAHLLHSRLGRRQLDLPSAPLEDSHWLWGHEYKIWKREASEAHLGWTAQAGPVHKIKAALFQPDIIVVSDPAAVSHILQNAYTYVKAPNLRHLNALLAGRGVTWAVGEEHKRQRRFISPAFTLTSVHGMQDDVVHCAEQLVENIKKQVGEQKAEVNVQPFISSCTLEIIGRIAFGYAFGTGKDSESEAISQAWHKDVVLSRTFAGFLAPIMITNFAWFNKLPIKALREDGVAKQIALKRALLMLKERAQSGPDEHHRDVLSILIQNEIDKHGRSADDWRLLENISTFIIVGHETTSCSVDFTLLELARDQRVQDKLRKELQSLSDFTVDNISKLEYLDAVVKEGLRLHPAAPNSDRVASIDDEIPLVKPITTPSGRQISSFPVKKGQFIQLPLGVMNMNPDVWGPEASLFQPERHLTPDRLPPLDQLPRGPYGNIATFSEGPRMCIGWRLAILELKIILAFLVQDLVFEETDKKVERFVTGTEQSFCEGKASCLPLNIRAA